MDEMTSEKTGMETVAGMALDSVPTAPASLQPPAASLLTAAARGRAGAENDGQLAQPQAGQAGAEPGQVGTELAGAGRQRADVAGAGRQGPAAEGTDRQGPAAEGAGQAQVGAKQASGPAGDEAVPDGPDGYTLEFAPATRIDGEFLGAFRTCAHELGLTRAQAQGLARMYEANVAAMAARAAQEEGLAREATRRSWEAQITARPGFEADMGRIRAALRQFGDDGVYALFDETSLGSHPVMFDFLARIGQALAEPAFHSQPVNAPKSAAEVLYPNMN